MIRIPLFLLTLLSCLSFQSDMLAQSITGSYAGQYVCRNQASNVELNIKEYPNRILVASFNIFPVVGSSKKPIGILKMLGKVDEKGTFQLNPNGWELRAGGYSPQKVSGKVRGSVLTMQLGSRMCKEAKLQKDMKKSEDLLDEIADWEKAVDKAPEEFRKAGSFKDQCGCLLKWSETFRKDYADLNFYGTVMGKINTMLLPLFSDDYFYPVFGTTFEKLRKADRSRIHVALSKCGNHKLFGDSFQWTHTLKSILSKDQGSPAYPETAQMVAAERPVRQEYHDLIKLTEEAYNPISGFQQLKPLTRLDKRKYERALFPSEIVYLESRMEEARGKLAAQIIQEKLEKLDLQPADFQKLVDIKNFKNGSNYSYIQYLLPDAKQKMESSLADINERSMNEVSRELKAEIDGWGMGLSAIKDGNSWLPTFQSQYQRNFRHPAIDDTYAYFQQKRQEVLERNDAELDRMISGTSDFDELNALQELYTSIELSNPTATNNIIQAVKDRKTAIKRTKIASGDKAYRWLYVMDQVKRIERQKLLARIDRMMIISKSGYDSLLVARQLKKQGIQVDTLAPFQLILEKETDLLTYTSSRNGTVIRKEDLYTYALKASIKAPAVIYAHEEFVHSWVTISSDMITGLYRRDNTKQIVYGEENHLYELVQGLFEPTDGRDLSPVSDEEWLLMMEENIPRAYSLYDLYQKTFSTTQLGLRFLSVNKVGEIDGYHSRENPVVGINETEALMSNQTFSTVFKLFGLDKLVDKWEPGKDWRAGFNSVDIESVNRNDHAGLYPRLLQKVSGANIELGGDSNYGDVHATQSHSFLEEPQCIVMLQDQLYRIPARSFDYMTFSYSTEELLAEINSLTAESINYFKGLIRQSRH